MLTSLGTFVDSVDQDQNAQNVQSDLWSTLLTFLFSVISELFLHLAMQIYFYPLKITIQLFGSERVNPFPISPFSDRPKLKEAADDN